MLGVAGAVIYVNWQLYVIAVLSGRVVEASLGYSSTRSSPCCSAW